MTWFLSRKAGNSIIDAVLVSRWVRWTWTGLSEIQYSSGLREYRPCDRESAREMFDGRYLLASKLVDTHGVSPFSAPVDHQPWYEELHGFAWLRHFEEARSREKREFARTLVLDWIGRFGEYDARSWNLVLVSRRVMNWLRHLSMLCQGASESQVRIIFNSISLQARAARIRAPHGGGGLEELMAAMLGVAISLCDGSDNQKIENLVSDLCKKLKANLHDGGFYRSRNSADQLALLEELVCLRISLSQRAGEPGDELNPIVDEMHRALDALTLSTGEPAYFNGCGQLPAELIFAIQNQGRQRFLGNGRVGGYGIIEMGQAKVIMDSGLVPEPSHALAAHASALAVEFSHGRDLIFGSCGPVPEELRNSRDLFRQSAAHSGPNIDGDSSARFGSGGVLLAKEAEPALDVRENEAEILARTGAFRSRHGVEIERRVTLLGDGETLVGQDKLIGAGGRRNFSGTFIQRFHLAPGAIAEKSDNEELVSVRLKSGALWMFLWEGASVDIDESVRQSAHIGYYRTFQIVLESMVEAGREVSWIFTRQ